MIVLDVRVPSVPVARLCNHRAAVNGVTWAPHSSCHICSAGKEWSIEWIWHYDKQEGISEMGKGSS